MTIGRYYYDGEGKRIKKVTDTETTVFVYSAGKLIAEYSTASPPTSPTTSYTMTDQLGSPRVLTNSFGEVVSRRDFMPFGEELYADAQNRTPARKFSTSGADSVRKRFTGYEKDIETGLDFAEARYYNNQHARFTAVDPLIASGRSADPQTFNRYSYVMNNPLVLTDPTGLQAASDPETIYGGTTRACQQYGFACVVATWFKETFSYGGDSVTATRPGVPTEDISIASRFLNNSGASRPGAAMSYLSPQSEDGGSGGMDAAIGIKGGAKNFLLQNLAGLSRNSPIGSPIAPYAIPWLLDTPANATQTVANIGTQFALSLSMGRGMGGPAATASSKSIPNGSYYSVAFETKISSEIFSKGYYSHFKAANTALSEASSSNPGLANQFSNLGINVPLTKAGSIAPKSPMNWVWHHDVNIGILQLVPKAQHATGSLFWRTLHPGGVGGMSIWGLKP